MKGVFLTAAVIAALGLGLAACETATPYQPAPPGGARSGAYGYSDYRIDSSHWRVSFAGNSLTSRETVEKYLLYRAAELTVQQGYDWFQTADRHTERNTSYYASPDPFYHSGFWASYGWGWRPYWRYGGAWGWRTWDPWFGDPFWASRADILQIDRYEAATEILLGKGPAPVGERVFNAHEVEANLGPQVARPTP
jgi:hypothetical protein